VSGHAADDPPQPRPDLDTAGFWEATARGELSLCRCEQCRRWQHPPVERCRECAGTTSFEPVSGAGTVFSFIVANRASVPGFSALVPYVIAVVELDEQPGLRLVSRLAGVEPTEVEIGLRVEAEIEELPGGKYHVAVFHPSSSMTSR
jgi:uncharacterized OB-fold protein